MKTLTKNEIKALGEFKRRLENKIGNVFAGIFLFGSKARGEAAKNSDIDILVLIKDNSRAYNRIISDISFDIMMEYSIDLSVITMGKPEWNSQQKTPTSFIFNVNKDKINL